MHFPQSNFLEVTINPQQLWVLVEGLHSRLEALQNRIAEVSTQAGGLETFVLQQTKKQCKELSSEVHRLMSTSKESYNQIRSSLGQRDDRCWKKLSEFQSIVNTLNHKLQTVKAELQDDLALKLGYLEKKIHSLQATQQETDKQSLSRIEEAIQRLNQLEQKQELSCNTQTELQDKLNKKLSLIDQQLLKYKEILEKDLSHKDKARSRHKIKTEKNLNNEETCLQGKSQKADYNTAKSKKDLNNTNNQDRRPKEMLRLLGQKIEAVNQTINEKLPEMKEKLDRYIVRSEIVNEQVEFLQRKLEKQKSQFNVLSQQIKLFEDRRNSQKEIQGLKTSMGQVTKDLNNGLQSKLNKEVFEKYQKYVNEKLSFLVESYFEKADKSQVKKGLSFLQDKLKEIIIVIAEQKQLSKDSALKKVAHCLSCDKQLEVGGESTKKQLRSSFNVQARASTPHLRKKYKNNYQTTLQDQS